MESRKLEHFVNKVVFGLDEVLLGRECVDCSALSFSAIERQDNRQGNQLISSRGSIQVAGRNPLDFIPCIQGSYR